MSEIAPEPQADEADAQPADGAPVADDQGNGAPVVPTDATPDAADDKDARIADIEAQLAAAEDRIAELESSPPADDGGFLGVRTPALDAFHENQFRGEVQAWERDTGLSYADTEPGQTDHVDEAIQAKADEIPTQAGG